VHNSDGGEIDRLALLAINDIEDFWKQHYSDFFAGTFKPVSKLLSYDSNHLIGPWVCGHAAYHFVNAFYCPSDDLIAWDRGKLLPTTKKYFRDMAINGVLAHEYGHAVQDTARLVQRGTPSLVQEQQAVCFSGVYLHWVAAGHSPRFTLSTDDDLSYVLAGGMVLHDPLLTPADLGQAHGTALDRISALQRGFNSGPEGCAEIDMNEINQRRGGLPASLFDSERQQSDIAIDSDTLSTLMAQLEKIFAPANSPTLITDSANCPDARSSEPASYCPASNAVAVDLPALQQISAPTDESRSYNWPKGDNTAISIVTSRYMLALQHERGLSLDFAMAAMRTACLTGVAQRKMIEPLPSGKGLFLAAGDLDEAVAGLLMNGLAASDAHGNPVPAGFTRILAFRSGLHGDTDECYQWFP
jgi:hypothetical protein